MTLTHIDTLSSMLAEARKDVQKDTDLWARLDCSQDTEEAEESGRLIGYAEGLEAALKLLDVSSSAS